MARSSWNSDESNAVVAGTGLTAVDLIYSSEGPRRVEALGGSCGNVLISLAMLGHLVAPIVALGDDREGEFLHEEFRRAGCLTRYVFRKADRESPVIVEHIDLSEARHWFSFSCPETKRPFPRYRSIGNEELEAARPTLSAVSVFYVDRLSNVTVKAMELASEAGAIVFFEPATRGDITLLQRALRAASIIKLSDETAGPAIREFELPSSTLVIRTHGAHGLTMSFRGENRFFPSVSAPRVVDTCGSGDMVTTGLLDRLLRDRVSPGNWAERTVNEGVAAGQRLAALNCAFTGARGAFRALSTSAIRATLDAEDDDRWTAYVTSSIDPYSRD